MLSSSVSPGWKRRDVGQKDSANSLTFLVAAQDHPGYGGTTLSAQKIVELGCLDGAEPDAVKDGVFHQRCLYGYNDYAASNVHQWLNGIGPDWFRPAHPKDEPPALPDTRYQEVAYQTRDGFLTGFSPRFREDLLEVQVPYLKMTRKDAGELAYVPAKVFLPSRTELGKRPL